MRAKGTLANTILQGQLEGSGDRQARQWLNDVKQWIGLSFHDMFRIYICNNCTIQPSWMQIKWYIILCSFLFCHNCVSDIRTRISRDRRHKGRKTHDEWLSESDYTCARRDSHVSPPRVKNAIYFTKWARIDDSARLYTVYRCRRGRMEGYNKMYCKEGSWQGKAPSCQVPGRFEVFI